MKLRNLPVVLVSVLAAFLLCIPVSANAYSLKLVSTGNAEVRGGVYAGQYLISVNGGSPVPMFCDDYFTEINVGDTWNATDTGPGKFVEDLYSKAAFLVQYATQYSSDRDMLASIGEALWMLMTTKDNGYLHGRMYQPPNDDLSEVTELIQLANQNYQNYSIWADFMVVYTPCGDSTSQEFLTAKPVPEPATMLLLGVGLIGLAGFGGKRLFKK